MINILPKKIDFDLLYKEVCLFEARKGERVSYIVMSKETEEYLNINCEYRCLNNNLKEGKVCSTIFGYAVANCDKLKFGDVDVK
jgi:hypothetical protein